MITNPLLWLNWNNSSSIRLSAPRLDFHERYTVLRNFLTQTIRFSFHTFGNLPLAPWLIYTNTFKVPFNAGTIYQTSKLQPQKLKTYFSTSYISQLLPNVIMSMACPWDSYTKDCRQLVDLCSSSVVLKSWVTFGTPETS